MHVETQSLILRWSDDAFLQKEESKLSFLLSFEPAVGPSDFRGITLGLPGSPKNLEWTSLINKTLTAVDLSFARLSCSFDKSVMENVNFSNASLDTSSMSHVRANVTHKAFS